MEKYPKMRDITNIEVVAKYNSGFEEWRSAYVEGATGKCGRKKDWKLEVTDEGNFETREIKKGYGKDQWVWETVVFNPQDWDNFYKWTFEHKGEKIMVELSWSQNKNLQDQLPSTMPPEGIKITPHFEGKPIIFSVEKKDGGTDLRLETTASEAGHAVLGTEPTEPRETTDADREALDKALPF